MIKVGKRQDLKVNNIAKIGVYLDAETGETEDNILLPNNEIEGMDIQEGDVLNVLIYSDSDDRPIATLKETPVTAGRVTKLEVIDINELGAFMDWGLVKDILLPLKQQECKVEIGKKYLVGIYEDSKGRPTATMRIYKFLAPSNVHEKNDLIKGTVYRIVPEIGVFVAVEDRYFGLIPSVEAKYSDYKIGEEIEARITRVREDKKLDLSPKQLAYIQMEDDAKLILQKIKLNHGKINIGDKSSPEEIQKVFKISKKSFKRAVGGLLKKGLIEKDGTGYKLK